MLLEVTLLGDGRQTPEYDKRLELRERLAGHRFVATATIPEMLYDAHPDATPDEVEQSAIEVADVVLCLEGPASAPLGMYTEVRTYFDPANPDKWYRLRPSNRPDAPDEAALIVGLARDPLRRIEAHDYEPVEWEACDRITRLCQERIELMAYRELDRRAAD